MYPGEYLSLRYNGAEIARVGNVSERGNYDVPSGTTIPKGNYTIGEEIPAGTYKIYFGGSTTSRVRVFQDADEASNTFNKGKETILDWNNTEGTVKLFSAASLKPTSASVAVSTPTISSRRPSLGKWSGCIKKKPPKRNGRMKFGIWKTSLPELKGEIPFFS